MAKAVAAAVAAAPAAVKNFIIKMMNCHCIHNLSIISGINQRQLLRRAPESFTNVIILSGKLCGELSETRGDWKRESVTERNRICWKMYLCNYDGCTENQSTNLHHKQKKKTHEELKFLPNYSLRTSFFFYYYYYYFGIVWVSVRAQITFILIDEQVPKNFQLQFVHFTKHTTFVSINDPIHH